MILAAWHRWVHTRQHWWLAVLGGVCLVDALVGGWLIAWELRTLSGAW